MKIVILSRKSSLYSTNALVEAGLEAGHDVQVINPLRCYMNITSHNPSIHYKGEPVTGVDAVIPASAHPSHSSALPLFVSLR